MEVPTKLAIREGGRLARILARWGLILGLAVAIGPSTAYTLLAIHHEGADFEAALDRRVVVLSRLAYSAGALWRFETHRIGDGVEPARSETGESLYRVEARDGDAWVPVIEAGTMPGWPRITRIAEVTDGDRVVGRIVGEHNIGHVLDVVLLVSGWSSLLGFAVYLLIRFRAIPFLRASIDRLGRHEGELATERAKLELLVAERTAALSETNGRLEKALAREREINQQQRRFVSVVSHEFRTPLTIIDGAAQRLARNAERLVADELRERVQRIRRAVARMSELIETSLSAAQVDAGAVSVARSRVELRPLLQAVCDRIRSIAPDFDVALHGGEDGMFADGDPRLLDQVFTNLLNNAVKYSGTSRSVVVELARQDDGTVVAVRDFGIGIPADELAKVFDRFYRASTAQGLPGTGIGLDLVREIVAMHQGAIDVASEVGVGTTFTVRLPSRLDATRDEGAVRAA